MSFALESLIRQMPDPVPALPREPGFVSFALIGGMGILAFLALNGLAGMVTPEGLGMVGMALCYLVVLFPVYRLHRHFTFASDARHSLALPRYLAVQAGTFLVASLFGFALTGTMTIPSLSSALIVLVLTSAINFVAVKNWAFARQKSPVLAVA